jgi:hypothetical protein
MSEPFYTKAPAPGRHSDDFFAILVLQDEFQSR